jgi:acetyl-CoA carboxylase biotin carboxylase subunit
VEFLVDAAEHFYFLEVNTRLQVEHPVTEMVTGFDLVKLQIRVAAGEALPFAQSDVTLSGHAIECRLYAEDPDNNFFPSPGTIRSLLTPSGPGIRLDDGVYEGFTVPTEYDPLLGKLIAWGRDRAEAIARLQRALEEYAVAGIKTNAALFRGILRDPEFVRGEIFTRWMDARLPHLRANRENSTVRDQSSEDAAILVALLHRAGTNNATRAGGRSAEPESLWKREARLEQANRGE